MALDEAMLAAAARGEWVLRLYRWIRPTVSLGYPQPWRTGFDAAAARRSGVALVRRPTGGRAVLHADELTYALAAPVKLGPLAGSVPESYLAVADGLREGLALLGADVRLERSAGATPSQRPRGGACFNARARYELVVDGRKLVGSAQRRRNGAVLQHGSVLVGRPDPLLWRALGEGGEEAACASVGLVEVLGERPSARRLAGCLARGLAAALGASVCWHVASRAEMRHARLLEGRYRERSWTQRR